MIRYIEGRLLWQKLVLEVLLIPRDPINLSDDDWGVQSPPQQGI